MGMGYLGVDRENYADLRGTRADLLINAAGDPAKRTAERDPLASFRANVEGPLAAIIDFPAGRYIHLSSVSVYNDLADRSRNNEEATIDAGQLSPYGRYKLLGETIVRTHAERWVIFRLCHVVGRGMTRNPIHDLVSGGHLHVHPASTMPFIHADDVAAMVWWLGQEVGEIFNLSAERAVALETVAREIGVSISDDAYKLPIERIDIDVTKLATRVQLPDSLDSVRRYVREWTATSSLL